MTLLVFMTKQERLECSPPVTKKDLLEERKLLKKWSEKAAENGNYLAAIQFEYLSRTICHEEIMYDY